MKKSIRIIVLLLMLLLILSLTAQAQVYPRGTWRAEYYDNPALTGHPMAIRTEQSFGHDWGYGSPDATIPIDHFSARWTAPAYFDAGTYLFILTVDDGARLWLDGQLIIDGWGIGGQEKLKAKVRVGKDGDHQIQVAYFEHTGQAAIHLQVLQIGQKDDIVGAWKGQYFANSTLSGVPAFVRDDGAINFNWDSQSPDPKLPRDNFSIRWTRSAYLREGKYHFQVQHDDGMRIYVDGKIVYDSWDDKVVNYEKGVVPIGEGYRTITVDYYDHVGNAVAQLWWEEDPGDYDDLVPDPNNPAVVVDNDSSRFQWFGPNPYMVGRGGAGENYYWISSVQSGQPSVGRWLPDLASAGNYEIFAYVPHAQASTHQARYQIQHFGRVAERTLNQGAYGGEWVSLGLYYFDAGGNEFVTLSNATGEANGSTQIAFDALKFIKRAPPPKP